MANGSYDGLYKAPKSGLMDIAALYSQGQAEIRKVRGEVREARALEQKNLTDLVEKIQLTGLQDADKMYNEGGVLLRNVISQAHEDNSNGLITREEATRRVNRAISEADLLVNSTTLIGQKYEDLKDKVEKGLASQADLDKFENGYFGKVNALGGTSVVTLEYGPNGLEFNRAYTYIDNSGTTPVMKKGVIISPLSKGIDPNDQGIQAFDGDDWADSVRKRINLMAAPVPGGTQTGPANQQYITFSQNPMNDDSVIEGIELMIQGYTDTELLGVLYDGLGGRATYSPSYVSKSNSQVQSEYKNPNGTSAFHKFDSNNKLVPIDFDVNKDGNLFEIGHEVDGTLILSDRQREMAQAFLRMSAFRALGVDYENRFGSKSSSRTNATASNTNFNAFNLIQPVGGSQTTPNTYIPNMIKNLAFLEQTNRMIAGVDPDRNQRGITDLTKDSQLLYSNYLTQNIPANFDYSNMGTNQGLNNFYKLADVDATSIASVTGRMFGQDDNQLTNLLVSETSSNRQDLNISTINGGQFDTIDNIGYIKGKDGRYTLVVHGKSEVTTTKLDSNNQKQSTRKDIIPAIGYLTPQESKILYNKLIRQYTQFNNGGKADLKLQIAQNVAKTRSQSGKPLDIYAYAISLRLDELVP